MLKKYVKGFFIPYCLYAKDFEFKHEYKNGFFEKILIEKQQVFDFLLMLDCLFYSYLYMLILFIFNKHIGLYLFDVTFAIMYFFGFSIFSGMFIKHLRKRKLFKSNSL